MHTDAFYYDIKFKISTNQFIKFNLQNKRAIFYQSIDTNAWKYNCIEFEYIVAEKEKAHRFLV